MSPTSPSLVAQSPIHRASDLHLGARRASGYKKSLIILPGHQLWETCLRIASGISKSVTKQIRFAQSRRAFSAVKSSDDFLSFDEETEEVISGEPSFGDDGLVFVDYAPSVFAQIRELHGIPQRAYLHSLGIERIIGGLILGKLHSFEEVVSTGRSGSFFLRSADGKYLIKSLPIEEHSFFRRILKAYYTVRHLLINTGEFFFLPHILSFQHVKHYPSTFLARFLGLHRIKNPKDPRQDLYFVVMENLFDTPLEIHEQYDLKGSTVNRFVGEKMETFNPSVALKDLDFHRRLRVGPTMKALMLEQAEIDCMVRCNQPPSLATLLIFFLQWMESLNICDYSMLVGLHYPSASISTPTTPSSAAAGARPRRNTATNAIAEETLKASLTSHLLDRSRFRRHFGGTKSVGSSSGDQDGLEEVVYFIGLIDILTQYDFNKKVEHNLKSIVYKKNEISAVAPEPYRKRLLWYMSSIID
jgi:1-phosphatidylinositol-4-phosphate 5-kinase